MAVVKQVLRDFALSYPLCDCLHKMGWLVCVNDVSIQKGEVFELLERNQLGFVFELAPSLVKVISIGHIVLRRTHSDHVSDSVLLCEFRCAHQEVVFVGTQGKQVVCEVNDLVSTFKSDVEGGPVCGEPLVHLDAFRLEFSLESVHMLVVRLGVY